MEFPPGGGTVPLPKSLHQPSTGPFVPDAVPQSDGSCVPVRVTAGLGEFRKESVIRTSGTRGRGDTHDPADAHTARAGLEHVPRCEKIDNLSELVNAANFLDATPDELMNDAFMNELGMEKHQDRQGVPVGAGTPLYPVRPEAGNNGTASAGVARPRSFVAMVPPVGLEPDSHDSHPALAASAVPEERESR